MLTGSVTRCEIDPQAIEWAPRDIEKRMVNNSLGCQTSIDFDESDSKQVLVYIKNVEVIVLSSLITRDGCN
jgi:hypothetical protein